MLFENTIFFIFKNKKQKTVFGCKTGFPIYIFFIENKKQFLKTIVKYALNVLNFYIQYKNLRNKQQVNKK